jgi:hypothetical protein
MKLYRGGVERHSTQDKTMLQAIVYTENMFSGLRNVFCFCFFFLNPENSFSILICLDYKSLIVAIYFSVVDDKFSCVNMLTS